MSRTTKYSRSPASSVRALSGSESDGENFLPLAPQTRSMSSRSPSRRSISSRESNNNNPVGAPNMAVPVSSSREQLNADLNRSTSGQVLGLRLNFSDSTISNVDFTGISLLNRIILCVYLFLLQMNHVDAWVLSRVRSQKWIWVFVIFLLLVFCVGYCSLSNSSFIRSALYTESLLPKSLPKLPDVAKIVNHESKGPFVELPTPSFFSKPNDDKKDVQPQIPNEENFKSIANAIWDERARMEKVEKSRNKEKESIVAAELQLIRIRTEEKFEMHKASTQEQDLKIRGLNAKLKQMEETMKQTYEENRKFQKNLEENEKIQKNLEEKIVILESQQTLVKNCCSEKVNVTELFQSFENQFAEILKHKLQSDPSFHDWLNSRYATHAKVTSEINSALEKFKEDTAKPEPLSASEINQIVDKVVSQHLATFKSSFTNPYKASVESISAESFAMDDITRKIKEAIMLYDADKNGRVDYALESGGGSVIGTRCSETYMDRNPRVSILGIPLWFSYSSPRTAIQPSVHPGECWAFKGSQGFLVIQLSTTIRPTGFSMEHIPVMLSPTGNIDSAPREFSVWALQSETDNEGKLLGKYTYSIEGEPLQYFPVQGNNTELLSYVELKIHSNNGNMEYTCLYRFRVHGKTS